MYLRMSKAIVADLKGDDLNTVVCTFSESNATDAASDSFWSGLGILVTIRSSSPPFGFSCIVRIAARTFLSNYMNIDFIINATITANYPHHLVAKFLWHYCCCHLTIKAGPNMRHI
ncbi:hypothetical protein O6H91_12G084100 [Diphasiastrum complanatum]|uniref:Uncharacterized protein n=1 Tax=Diphasiastrum complanatum TaxID=34168 RepID=A0ACC2C4B6_DIPCM|nr:hypothetical protein O6H91_12G084100 [Diphasiastrum complanatum]